MNLWHRHLVLQGKAKREGRIARRVEPSKHRHVWAYYNRDTDMYRCACGERISFLDLSDSNQVT